MYQSTMYQSDALSARFFQHFSIELISLHLVHLRIIKPCFVLAVDHIKLEKCYSVQEGIHQNSKLDNFRFLSLSAERNKIKREVGSGKKTVQTFNAR